MDKIKEFIAHYSSEYYDPVKAHEYYLKTRELKGRRSSSELKTEDKKQAWSYAKNQISEAKKAELDAAAKTHEESVKKLREAAVSRRDEISNKLRELVLRFSESRKQKSQKLAQDRKKKAKEIAQTSKEQSKQISDWLVKKIDSLPPIPKGVSKEQRAKLAAERSAKIAKFRNQAEKGRKEVARQTRVSRIKVRKEDKRQREVLAFVSNAEKAREKDALSSERQAISDGLKSAVDKARSDYESLKESLKAKYETTLDKEYAAIKQNV